MDVIAFIHGRLAEDLPLAALLASYRGEPSVFGDRVPPDAEPPWILLEGPLSEEAEDARGLRLRRLELRLRCLDRTGAGGGRLQAVAARVRALLHEWELVAGGGLLLAQVCSGPLAEAAEEGFLQHRFDVSLLCNELGEEA